MRRAGWSGFTLSDDPFPALRSAVYALSVAHRGVATNVSR